MRRSSKCKYLRCLLASAKSSSYPSSVFQSDLCQLPQGPAQPSARALCGPRAAVCQPAQRSRAVPTMPRCPPRRAASCRGARRGSSCMRRPRRGLASYRVPPAARLGCELRKGHVADAVRVLPWLSSAALVKLSWRLAAVPLRRLYLSGCAGCLQPRAGLETLLAAAMHRVLVFRQPVERALLGELGGWGVCCTPGIGASWCVARAGKASFPRSCLKVL